MAGEAGITGIVLKYRMPNQHDRIPMTDALRAMKWVRSRSEEWGIDPAKVGIAGFSAGGHLASTVSTHFDSGKTELPTVWSNIVPGLIFRFFFIQ